jgi:hypothetical protein
LHRLPLVKGVEALGDVSVDDSIQFLDGGGQGLEGGKDGLGEGLDLLEGSRRLAADDPGDRLVKDFPAGESGLHGDLAGLDRQRPGRGLDGAGQIGERTGLAAQVEDSTEVRRHLFLETLGISTGPAAGFDPGPELGDEIVDVGGRLVRLVHGIDGSKQEP